MHIDTARLAGRRWWSAPAKLNLFLHINSQRPDGYHEIQTVFQLIARCDLLGYEPLEQTDCIERRLHSSGASQPEARASIGVPEWASDADLTVRAARALQTLAGTPCGVRIHLRKRLPVGGGLGGGSSDAATTLHVLNRLWRLRLQAVDLEQIARRLGADVPVFVRGCTAFAQGIGEQLAPFATPPEHWFLVVDPGIQVSTREVFQAPELTRNSPIVTMRALSLAETRNDCEAVVRGRYAPVAEALDWLSMYAPARLTGTGSCVFASFESAASAERVAARVPDRWRAFVARGIARSPLLDELEEVDAIDGLA